MMFIFTNDQIRNLTKTKFIRKKKQIPTLVYILIPASQEQAKKKHRSLLKKKEQIPTLVYILTPASQEQAHKKKTNKKKSFKKTNFLTNHTQV